MGDVPINPSGFAHGFRPLDGADNPPPTPTQRNITQRDVGVPGGTFLSGLTQQTTVDTPGGVMGTGLGSSRKRRRLPGPLAVLQQGHSGSLGQQENGGGSDDDNQQRLNDDSDRDEGVAGGGHFSKGPWLSLCSAVDAPIPGEGASDSKAVQTFLRSAVSPISEVLSGDFDLRVPVVTAVIDTYTQLSVSDVIVELVDPSGRIKGYLHPGCLEEHGPLLGPGAALLLKEVSIFVSGPGTTRLLNVHPDCVLAVFPADTPLPTPSRVEWLTNCEPPFTPRSVADSGDHAFTPPPALRRTPPPPTSPAASNAARPNGATSRRRPRPLAAREGPEQQWSQGQSLQQRETTPRISPPAPQSLEPRQGEQREQRRHQQQPRQAPATTNGGTPPTQESEPPSTSPRRTSHGCRPLPASRSPSPPLVYPSPPEMSSPSQSSQRQHEQIPLGQHSNDEGEGREAGAGKAEGGTVGSASSVASMGGCGAISGTREDGNRHSRARLGALTPIGGRTWQSPGRVDKQDSCSRGGDGRCGGVSASPGSTSAQQKGSLRTLGSVNSDCGGGGGVGREGENFGVGGRVGKVAVPAGLLQKRTTDGISLPGRGGGKAVGPGKAKYSALSSGDVSGSPAHSGGATKPAPSSDADRPIPSEANNRASAFGVGETRLGGDLAPGTAPSSIWADLHGLASGDDNTSDDDQGATQSGIGTSHRSKVPCLPRGPAVSSTAAVVDVAAGKADRSATPVAGDAARDRTERREAQLVSCGDSPAAEGAGRGARRNAGFSLLAGAGGNLGDNELLDAALEDSD